MHRWVRAARLVFALALTLSVCGRAEAGAIDALARLALKSNLLRTLTREEASALTSAKSLSELVARNSGLAAKLGLVDDGAAVAARGLNSEFSAAQDLLRASRPLPGNSLGSFGHAVPERNWLQDVDTASPAFRNPLGLEAARAPGSQAAAAARKTDNAAARTARFFEGSAADQPARGAGTPGLVPTPPVGQPISHYGVGRYVGQGSSHNELSPGLSAILNRGASSGTVAERELANTGSAAAKLLEPSATAAKAGGQTAKDAPLSSEELASLFVQSPLFRELAKQEAQRVAPTTLSELWASGSLSRLSTELSARRALGLGETRPLYLGQ